MDTVPVHVETAPLPSRPPRGIAVALFEEEVAERRFPAGLADWLGDAPGRLTAGADFAGKPGEGLEAGPFQVGLERLVLAGLGKRKDFEIDRFRRAAGSAIARLVAAGSTSPAILLRELPGTGPSEASRAAAEGALLATYRYEQYKEPAPRKRNALAALEIRVAPGRDPAGIEDAARTGWIVGEAVNVARDLGNRPPNRKTPAHLGDFAAAMAARRGLGCQILSPEEIEALPMPSFLGVAKGSAEPASLIVLEYRPPRAASSEPVALVGKGITFDSGGISIKPAEKMGLMKFDMAGAAAVLAAMEGAARLELPLHLVAVLPFCENLPGGRALKPADCLETHAGKTVEIVTTDAEGRLILADALSYAATRYRPGLVIDLATLTSACGIALGKAHIGLFGTAEDAMRDLVEVGRWTGDRVWPMPIAEDHHEAVKGDTADLKNSGGKLGAACNAAAFLSNFVHDVPWIHLDIAPTASTEEARPLLPKGATGSGVRLLLEFLRRRSIR